MTRPPTAPARDASSDRRWLIVGVATVPGVALLVFALAVIDIPSGSGARGTQPSSRSVGFETAPPAAADPGTASKESGPLLRVAVAPVLSPEISITLYRGLAAYLGEAVGRRGVLVQRSSYSEINSLLRHGQCDVAFVCTRAYVEGRRDFDLQVLAAPVVRGATSYRSYFIVRNDSPAKSILDMNGTRLASADVLSNTGFLYPEFVLLGEGHRIHRFFSEIVFTQGHDRAMRAVASGVADFAAVDDLVYEHVVRQDPAIATALRVIHTSPEFGMPPLVVPKGIDPTLLVRLRQALLEMHGTAAGMEALGPLGFERFQPARDEDYDAIRKMVWAIEGAR